MSISYISPKVRYLLWAKAAGRCQFDGCNEPLYQDHVTQIEMNFADVAHIIGDRPGGPRGDEIFSLDKEYCNSASNLMLMCPKHHRMIDQITETFSLEAMRSMKKEHETRIRMLTAIKPNKKSNVIIYRGRVGNVQPAIEFQEAMLAMSPDFYPSDHFAHELSMSGSMLPDDDPDFWNTQAENLELQFRRKIEHLLGSEKERNHYSVFAFAPNPLLIKLGTLLPDHYPAQVYQCKREPRSWAWEAEPEKFNFLISEPSSVQHEIVALNLSLSADIDNKRIYDALNTNDVSIWKMDITETIYPKNDHLRAKGQLVLFARYFRRLLNQIKSVHGQNSIVHVFPAISIAYAVEIGRVRQPKADLPLKIYDQNNKVGGFSPAFVIE